MVKGSQTCINIRLCGLPWGFSCKVAGGSAATTGSSASGNTYAVRDGQYYSSCTWKNQMDTEDVYKKSSHNSKKTICDLEM